ncbi:MAG: cell division ATPase MinD [Candidatus Aenigmatarchaeota archaeon]|nr:cell division ATPase MinD [Candidatus Aenigmarchaeota archaeon]
MTRIISIASGKGGVGKTTLVSNLSHVLTELGKDVTVIDANLTTPHLGLHLGFHMVPKSLHDFLRGDAKLKDIIYYHPYGFKVIPAGLSVNELIGVDANKLQNLTLNLLGKTDFILLDSAPSLGKEATLSLKISDEILLLTNPNIPAVLDILKVAKIAENLNKVILGIVVNRVNRKENELSLKEIEDLVKYPVISEIPEDINVQKSLTARRALVDYNPESPAAIEMRKLGYFLVGKEFNYKQSFLKRLFSWFK